MIVRLYEWFYRELLNWCKTFTENREQAEDLVQEAFLRAMQNMETLEGLERQQCRAWLYRTAKNLYVDRLRRARRETISDTVPEWGETASEYTELETRQLLARLPEEERVIFVMRYLEGYNATEIGNIFGLPPATVRSRLSAARKHLRKEMED